MGGGASFRERESQLQRRDQERKERQGRMFDERLERVRKARAEDLAAGRARGQELFGEGKLGRIADVRRPDIERVISERRAQLSGLTPEEEQLMREGTARQLQRTTQGQLRQLRGLQAQAGLRGGTAAAQQAQVLRGGAEQRANLERDILRDQIAARRQALGAFEGTLGREREAAQFDIGQAGRERMGQLSTELGFGQLGAAERSSVLQQIAGEEAARVAERQAARGGKK